VSLRWPRSLQTRLLALLLALLAGVWAVAAVLTWVDVQHELDELLDGHLAQTAALLLARPAGVSASAVVPLRLPDSVVPDEHHPAPHKYAPKVAFQVFQDQRLELYSAHAGTTPLSSHRQGFDTVRLDDHGPWRVFAAHDPSARVQVYVAEQVSSRREILWAVLQSVLTPLLVALPLLGLVGWLAVRRGLAPLRALSQALRSRRAQALDALVLPDPPAEIEPVLQSLNALFERVSQMLSAERRFTADAAHELRTPIAAIRMQAQVALGAGAQDQVRERALLQTLAGCDRATHLVEQLLTLSRLEASSAAAPRQRIDVAALAQQVAADLAPLALARGQQIELQAGSACHVDADAALLRVLLRNLLDNALRYSPDGANVRVLIEPVGAAVLLQVHDSGPGLAAPEMARLGERFFRLPGQSQPGSGLGWSIVRRIASAYQAQISVQRSPTLGGLAVHIHWPS